MVRAQLAEALRAEVQQLVLFSIRHRYVAGLRSVEGIRPISVKKACIYECRNNQLLGCTV
jgi:hypothetical protein